MTMVMGQQAIPSIASESDDQPASTNEPAGLVSQQSSEVGTEGGNGMDGADDVDMDNDVNMDGLDNSEEPSGEIENQDWVMVDENANQTPEKQPDPAQSSEPAPTIPTEQALPEAPPAQQMPTEQTAPVSTAEPVAAEEAVVAQPAKEVTPPALQDSGLDADDLGLGDDFDDVGNMDTAGDALAQYGETDDLDLDNMDDSAFGDAFHPPDD